MARELPWVKDTMREDVPGVGTFALQSVGNTTYSTAVHVYLQPEGSPTVARGAIDFKLAITPDFRLEWYHDGTAGAWTPNERVFTEEQVAAGLELVKTYDQRDAVSFMFLALSCAEMEIEKKRREIEGFERNRDALVRASTGLIKTSWTPDEIGPRLERASARIAEFHDVNDARIERLKGLVKAIRDWTHRRRGGSILDVMQEALGNDEAAVSLPAPAL